MKQISDACRDMLRRLYNRRVIGGKHIPEPLCLSWIKHLPKKQHKQAVKDWNWCIRQELIITKPKPSKRHVSLNAKKIQEITELVQFTRI